MHPVPVPRNGTGGPGKPLRPRGLPLEPQDFSRASAASPAYFTPWCSRRCVAIKSFNVATWDRTLEDELPLAALRMALSHRSVQPGLVHHSDRGSQYASVDYTDLLRAHQINISMSRKGNPWDNAACESFMKTLKYEEVLRNEYRDLAEARASIREFLEKIYNQRRLHSALGHLPPAEFERKLNANRQDAALRQLPL
jgi:transposase InsO family protein